MAIISHVVFGGFPVSVHGLLGAKTIASGKALAEATQLRAIVRRCAFSFVRLPSWVTDGALKISSLHTLELAPPPHVKESVARLAPSDVT